MSKLDHLAKEIAREANRNGGVYPKVYTIPRKEWCEIYIELQQRREEEGRPFWVADIDRPNFLIDEVPVVAE